jgi:hypothetical protein
MDTHCNKFVDDLSKAADAARTTFTQIVAQQELENRSASGTQTAQKENT